MDKQHESIEWVMDHYQLLTHEVSGIKNDMNDGAEEFGNLRYILDLLISISNQIVKKGMIVEVGLK